MSCRVIRLAVVTAILPAIVPTLPSTARGGTDVFGDPLPEAAVARIGTVRSADEVPASHVSPWSLRGVRFSPEGTLIATRGEPADPTKTRTVHLWEAATGRLVRTISTHPAPLRSLEFSPDGRLLVTGTPDHPRGTQVWEVATGKLVTAFAGGRGQVRLSPDGGSVLVVDRFRNKDVIGAHRLPAGNETSRSVVEVSHRLEFSPTGRHLLSLKSERSADLRVLDINSATELARLQLGDGRPGRMTFSPNGYTVAAALQSRSRREKTFEAVVLWELASGQRAFELTGHASRVLAVAFSPDGRFVVTAGADKAVRVWETATGRPVHVFEGHRLPVTTLDVSPDSRRLASGSLDRTVLVWDLAAVARSFLPQTPVDEETFEGIWEGLASHPSTAYVAMGRLRAEGDRATELLQDRVESILVPVEVERIRKLIRDLGHDDYRVRNRATNQLKRLREIAHPILLKALEQTSSQEVRVRIGRILSISANAPRFSASDILRMRRTIHVLRQLRGPASEATLQLIVAEFPHQQVVAEARQALERLQQP